MISLWYLLASQCRTQNMWGSVASGIKVNYWTNLGKKRECEWFKNKFQGSKLLQVEGSSPSLPLLGQKVMDVFPSLPLSTYRLWYGRTLPCPQKARKRKQSGLWNCRRKSLNYFRADCNWCASALEMLQVKDAYVLFSGAGGGVSKSLLPQSKV